VRIIGVSTHKLAVACPCQSRALESERDRTDSLACRQAEAELRPIPFASAEKNWDESTEILALPCVNSN